MLEDSSNPSDHTITIGGVVCATLGHGIINDDADIRSSEFWGKQVVEDLKTMTGWKDGYVCIESPIISRSEETGLVCKLQDKVGIEIK